MSPPPFHIDPDIGKARTMPADVYGGSEWFDRQREQLWPRSWRMTSAPHGRPGREAVWPFELSVITNKGLKIWPDGAPETIQTDHCRCRFFGAADRRLTHFDVVELLARLADRGFDFIKTEHLYEFDGVPGFTQAQGE